MKEWKKKTLYTAYKKNLVKLNPKEVANNVKVSRNRTEEA